MRLVAGLAVLQNRRMSKLFLKNLLVVALVTETLLFGVQQRSRVGIVRRMAGQTALASLNWTVHHFPGEISLLICVAAKTEVCSLSFRSK